MTEPIDLHAPRELRGASWLADRRLDGWVKAAGIPAVLLLAVLALTVPFFNTPHFWDGLTFIAGAEHIYDHALAPWLPPGEDYGHPVLLQEVIALAWRVFGQGLWVSHAVIAAFAFLAVYFTYRIGEQLYGTQIGLIAAGLLLVYPLFRAQTTVVALDLPSAAFALLALDALLRGRTWLYVVASSAAILTKITAVTLVLAVLVYLLVHYRRSGWAEKARRLAVHSVPLLVMLGWFSYHKYTTGWISAEDNLGWFALPSQMTFSDLLLGYLPRMLFSRQGILFSLLYLTVGYFAIRFLVGGLTLLILVYSFSLRPFAPLLRGRVSWSGLIAAWRAQPVWRVWGTSGALVLLGVPIALRLLLMSSSVSLHRYLLPEYPLFFILAARAIVGLFRSDQARLAVVMSTGALFTLGWSHPWFAASLAAPSNLRYTDFVAVHQQAAAFIETHYPDATVLAGWPQYVELAMPIQGYVHQPHRVVAFAPLARHQARLASLGGHAFTTPSTLTMDDFDLVYSSARAYDKDMVMLQAVIDKYHLPRLAEFRQGQDYAAIYGKPKKSAN